MKKLTVLKILSEYTKKVKNEAIIWFFRDGRVSYITLKVGQ